MATPIDLQQAARDHLWLHFTCMGWYGQAEIPVIEAGSTFTEEGGPYEWMSNSRRTRWEHWGW